MKKIASLLFAASISLIAGAQALNVVNGDITYTFSAEQTGTMPYNGDNVTIQGKVFYLSDDITMNVTDKTLVDDNKVNIVYDGNKAGVTIAGNIAPYITATVNGAHVKIEQGSGIGDDTGEVTYILSGSSTDGSLCLEGSYKSTIELQGLTLTNPSGAAIDIQNGKRIELSSKNGTVNTLSDGPGSSQKAALYCKGHLELKGKGTLYVESKIGHAIAAKEYVEMKNCTINITGAVKDGINCTQHFLQESGTLNISGTGDDGIQCDFNDSENREDDDTGTIEIQGGETNITITATAAKAISAEGDFVMSGGQLNATTTGAGDWDSKKLKTKASACIAVDGNVTIKGGTINLESTGGGGKGITANGAFTFNDGELTISTSGGVLAYVNGALNQNYTGNTDNLKSDYKSSPKGIKVDENAIINGGKIFVTTSGNGGEGIESKAELTINDGFVKVRAKDDAINSSSHMYIKGGTIDVISTGNDGLDANGNIYIEGGVIMAFGSSAPECGIDANEEDGYTVYITGGYLLAAGGKNSVPTKDGSSQPFVSVNATVNANTTVSIGTSTSTIYSFTTPSDLTNVTLGGGSSGNRPGGPGGMGNGSSSLMISVPGLTNGTSYTVTSDTTSTTGTAKTTGSSNGPR